MSCGDRVCAVRAADLRIIREQARPLNATRALVAKYRAVPSSAAAVLYVRDLERALGMDLPPVTDRDGRNDW